MDVVLLMYVMGDDKPVMSIINPPAIPNVGDFSISAEGVIFQVVQRAFLPVAPKQTLKLVGVEQEKGSITIECIMQPVQVQEAPDAEPRDTV